MGWADCGTDDLGRPIGYGFTACCDYGHVKLERSNTEISPCLTPIDRGLSYVCGSMHGGDTWGCGRYFCPAHLTSIDVPDTIMPTRCISVCEACADAYERSLGEENEHE